MSLSIIAIIFWILFALVVAAATNTWWPILSLVVGLFVGLVIGWLVVDRRGVRIRVYPGKPKP